MAAVQQRSPTGSLTPSDTKNVDFISSMEDEVRRCAEHLERRQSRKGYRSLERKPNGYSSSSSSGSYPESRTLPRSFTIPTDQEEMSALSPRVIAPGGGLAPGGGRSPRKSPAENIFKFTNGVDGGVLQQHQVREEIDSSIAGYHKGSCSAPPDTSSYFSTGNGSCRDTPLQSPHGRMPIGAVSSHSQSGRSSVSSSPPPAVPPKRQCATPPVVPPKPGSRRARSQTPSSPNRTYKMHKVTVSTVRRHSLNLSPPPPLDPALISQLSAEDVSKDQSASFPSAEVELENFHDKILKAKSLLRLSTDLDGSDPAVATDRTVVDSVRMVADVGMESSVDAEDYNPAPPPSLGSGSAKLGSAADSAATGHKVATPTSLATPISCVSVRDNEDHGTGQTPAERKTHFERTESSVDVASSKCHESADTSAAGETVPSDLSLDSHSTCPSISDPFSQLSIDEQPTPSPDVAKGRVGVGVAETSTERVLSVEEIEVEQKVEELLEKLSRTTKTYTPVEVSTSKSSATGQLPQGTLEGEAVRQDQEGKIPVSITNSPERAGKVSTIPVQNTTATTSSPFPPSMTSEPEVTTIPLQPGMPSSSTETEPEVKSIPPQTPGIPSSSTETEPEVKTIPLQAHSSSVPSKHRSHRSHRGTKHSRHSSTSRSEDGSDTPRETSQHKVIISSVDRPEPSSAHGSGGVESDGMSESVALLVKELQIKLREKEEDLARLERQKQRELKEKDEVVKKLTREAKKMEREKWELLKRARDAAERSLYLRTQLDTKEGSLHSVQGELDRTRDELMSVKSANTSLRALLSDLRVAHPSVDVGVQVDLGAAAGGSLHRRRSIEMAFTQGGLSQEQEAGFERSDDNRMSSSSLGLHWPERWDNRSDRVSLDSSALHDFSREENLSAGNHQPLGSRESRKSKKRGQLLGKLRKTSLRGSKTSITSMTSTDGLDLSQSSLIGGRGVSNVGSPYHPVASELKEHWRTLEEAKATPFIKWNLKVMVAWLEAGLGMTQYSRAIVDKCPSTSALLALTDSDMEKKLGISNSLHRRKLGLALVEKKSPQMSQYPHAGKIDHSWVAFEWAHDCGLAHLTEILTAHMIDGRVLNSLTKDDLKKHLKITKKVDQMSFLSGVELLRMHDFNREAIQEHRKNTRNPLYWTNRDMADWLYRIDLQDYANNVIGGGVHGALLFLERGRFSADHLSSIIQIPSNKGQLRRHLAGKMASLFSEDVSGSMDILTSYSPLDLSPSNGSQSPTRHPRSHTSTPSGTTTPTDFHPNRRNSLSRRAMQFSPSNLLTESPPSLRRMGSTPLSMRGHNFQRSTQADLAERTRISLRESALRSITSEEVSSRSITPTVLSSTTV